MRLDAKEIRRSATHLEVRQCGIQLDTPVDESVGTVDHALLMHLEKGLSNSGGKLLKEPWHVSHVVNRTT